MDSFLPGSFPLSSATDLESVEEDLNIFGKVRVNDCILDSSYLELLPITSYNGDTKEFTFEIPATPLPKYLVLSDIYCSTRVSIVKVAEGSSVEEPVSTKDNITLADFAPDSLFTKFDTYIGDQTISNSCEHRNIYTHLVRQSSFSKNALNTYLSIENAAYNGFSADSVDTQSHKKKVGTFASDDPNTIPVVHLVGILTHDFNSMKQPLPQIASLKFHLRRADDKEVLFGFPAEEELTEEEEAAKAAELVAEELAKAGQNVAAAAVRVASSTSSEQDNGTDTAEAEKKKKKKYSYKLKIVSISLLVKRITISNSLVAKHRQMFENGGVARYYFYRSISAWFAIPKGVSQFMSPRLFSASSLPAKIMFVFFEQDRLQGKYNLNIQKYCRPRYLTSVNLSLDNRNVDAFGSVHSENLDDGLDNFLYSRLFMTMGNYYSNTGPPITKSQFLSDFFVIMHDLSTAMDTLENALPLIKSGDLKLSLKFSQPTEKNYHCLAFASSPSLLTMDGNAVCAVSYRT